MNAHAHGSSTHLICPACGAENRVPTQRLGPEAVCGKCRARLFPDEPITLSPDSFERHLAKDGVPLLVDFWAPWCGPCLSMAPMFKAATPALIPRARLAKLDTEAHPGPSQRLGIRGIPTMILFRGGREAGRISGAMETSMILRWAEGRLAA
ncbi:MAG: thiol reductase thioredoxin [Alphaproteobacteria bacterium]|jgi:thioredoxin 2|nr:thiol reductase thioredoxin [Alphaproteobacteria bacterium]